MSLPSSAPPSRGAVAASEQDLSDADFAELDALLADIPEPLEPLDAVMLDGFLCGVLVQPEIVAVDDWLPFVFDAGGHRWGEAEPSPEQVRARVLVLRRHAALNRSLAEFGAFDPFVLEPLAGDAGEDAAAEAEPGSAADPAPPADPIGAALLPWVAGFEQAVHLLPGLAELEDGAVTTTLARLFRFLPESDDDPHGIFALVERERPLGSLDEAIGEVVGCVADLYELTAPLRYKVAAIRRDAPKVGRNDPCPCGSGKKFKQCHGAAGATKA
jgi:uncharacterized protein